MCVDNSISRVFVRSIFLKVFPAELCHRCFRSKAFFSGFSKVCCHLGRISPASSVEIARRRDPEEPFSQSIYDCYLPFIAKQSHIRAIVHASAAPGHPEMSALFFHYSASSAARATIHWLSWGCGIPLSPFLLCDLSNATSVF